MTKSTRTLFVVFTLAIMTSATGCLGFGAGCGPLRALVGIC